MAACHPIFQEVIQKSLKPITAHTHLESTVCNFYTVKNIHFVTLSLWYINIFLWRESTTPNCATGLQVIGFFSSTQDSRLRQAIASEIENYKSKLKSSTPVFSFHFATQWSFLFVLAQTGKGEERRRYRMEWGDGIEGDFITPELFAILGQKLVHEKRAWIYTDNNYLCTCDLYSPVHNVLDACIYITWETRRGLGAGIPEFLGPVKWERADMRVPFGAQKNWEFQGPAPSHFPK